MFFINTTIWFAQSFLTLMLVLVVFLQKNHLKSEGMPTFQLEDTLEELKKVRGLTKRETDILREIYYGKSNGQISEKYDISENTVKVHVHNLLEKMGAGSRLEAVYLLQNSEYTKKH